MTQMEMCLNTMQNEAMNTPKTTINLLETMLIDYVGLIDLCVLFYSSIRPNTCCIVLLIVMLFIIANIVTNHSLLRNNLRINSFQYCRVVVL